MIKTSVEIDRYNFNTSLFESFNKFHYAKELWPVVYILSDSEIKEAYVGETTDILARTKSHLTSETKKKLTAIHLINSNKFNKSATLDIESKLIQYFAGDGEYKLLNGNIGLANHSYYQKAELYWDIFTDIWDRLIKLGVTKHSIDYIDNSDLFKYSPYKMLSKDQVNGLKAILQNLLDTRFKSIVVEGGAGTGKTVLAMFLFKLLNTENRDFNFKDFGEEEKDLIMIVKKLKEKYPNPKMALVVPMSSFRKTLQKIFKNITGLKSSMVIAPAELIKDKYDIVLVDESHRLRRRVNLGAYFGAFDKVCEKLNLDKLTCSELDWVNLQAEKAIFLYDKNQSIKPSDVLKQSFDALKQSSSSGITQLKSQFRVKGGTQYVTFVDDLLNCRVDKHEKYYFSKDYELCLFESLEDMVNEIRARDSTVGLSRLIAGYSWPWLSKTDSSKIDIHIDGIGLKWNSVTTDWVNSVNAINEVGCIHTTQGYDLNYTGVIFGREITYDKADNKIVISEKDYYDKNGKQSIKNPNELKEFIINIYKTILLRGIKGTYIYVCDEQLRNYFSQIMPTVKRKADLVPLFSFSEVNPFVDSVPFYDLKAAAGDFSNSQKIEDFAWVKLPKHLKVTSDLFACKVVGDSMNRIIPNGSVCLFRKATAGSRNGKIVLVESTLIQDSELGSRYTVKEYSSVKRSEGDSWKHTKIVLKPRSFDESYSPIEIQENELESLTVVGIFECVL
jgi:uncharacterized protein